MKVGDLVKHIPGSATNDIVRTLHVDWGHEPDFQSGIIVRTRDNFAQVLASKPSASPSWYEFEELAVLSSAK